jgi:hypothetical protein
MLTIFSKSFALNAEKKVVIGEKDDFFQIIPSGCKKGHDLMLNQNR